MSAKLIVGWREWLALPALGIPAIKAKVDTGARTSCLHAWQVERLRADGKELVRFDVHPLQDNRELSLRCTAELLDQRLVSDSGGHRELRWVVRTPIRVGALQWPVELTLTDRDSMRFRMLLGRTAMLGRILVDPEASYLSAGQPDLATVYANQPSNPSEDP